MKKILTLAMVLLLVLSFAACGSAEAKEVDINSVCAQAKALVAEDEPLDFSSASFTELYAIEQADMAQAVGFATMDGSFPDEVVLIKATDDAALQRIKTILQNHLDNVMDQAEDYDAENFALLQKCKVLVSGDTVALFVSDHFSEMEQIFLNASKG